MERQIRKFSSDLPPRYYRQLPSLLTGPFARYPRVFGMAWAFVAHTDSRFDVDLWCSFVRAYQKVQPLTIGELWASAITLRIILIENLRRIAERIVYSRKERRRADELADRLLGVDGQCRASMPIQMELEQGALSDAFLSNSSIGCATEGPTVTRYLPVSTSGWRQGKDRGSARSTTNSRSRSPPTSPSATSSPACAACPMSIGRKFSSASASSTPCWPMAALLRRWISRPATCTAQPSRSSRAGPASANWRLLAARSQTGAQAEPEAPEVGRARLILATIFAPAAASSSRPRSAFGRASKRCSAVSTARSALAAISARARLWPRCSWRLPIIVHADASRSWIWLGLLGTLGAIPALDAAVALVNQGVTHRFRRHAVAGPRTSRWRAQTSADARGRADVLLTTREAIDAQIEHLEIHYLASLAGDVQFALLSDWTDAASEAAEGDQALLPSRHRRALRA